MDITMVGIPKRERRRTFRVAPALGGPGSMEASRRYCRSPPQSDSFLAERPGRLRV